jgi:ornithine--oxo-acid transaminase
MAMEFDKGAKLSAYNMCEIMKEHGLLAKPTHENKLRFSPALVITAE